MLEIVPVPTFADNYVWLAHDPVSRETAVVDPGQAEPVLAEAQARGWAITQIWNTHWHDDHIGGNAAIKAATGALVTAPAREADRVATADVLVGEGDTVRLGEHIGHVLALPGHTLGHIAYHLPGVLFAGDTLFAMGCGRIFEGTAEQMWGNMQRLAALPPETLVYAAHEYTLGNARFALTIEPESAALQQRAATVTAQREAGQITLPTSIAQELATNPFIRAGSVEDFARRRAAKDVF
ncbi:hydroxyacylglutathione hydrolase [Novosphingobium terrae]|uniref:hydroxyacylglutathione hydrolase n=1 Tax=Novosphingobium terrae TaxID=2726189 RepID=UPI0019825200|nr:hydroxyacylglutathione hydrolase [Novosphingobium terrae]